MIHIYSPFNHANLIWPSLSYCGLKGPCPSLGHLKNTSYFIREMHMSGPIAIVYILVHKSAFPAVTKVCATKLMSRELEREQLSTYLETLGVSANELFDLVAVFVDLESGQLSRIFQHNTTGHSMDRVGSPI